MLTIFDPHRTLAIQQYPSGQGVHLQVQIDPAQGRPGLR